MKHLSAKVCAILLSSAALVTAATPPMPWYETVGVIPTGQIAEHVAFPILEGLYGKGTIHPQVLEARLRQKIWIVEGVLPDHSLGEPFEIWIRMEDGQVAWVKDLRTRFRDKYPRPKQGAETPIPATPKKPWYETVGVIPTKEIAQQVALPILEGLYEKNAIGPHKLEATLNKGVWTVKEVFPVNTMGEPFEIWLRMDNGKVAWVKDFRTSYRNKYPRPKEKREHLKR